MSLENTAPPEPWTIEKFTLFLERSVAWLAEQQAQLIEEFDLTSYDRFDVYLETGELIFSRDDTPVVIAEVQMVGTHAVEEQTWMWAWANTSLPPQVTRDARRVKQFSEARKIYPLMSPQAAEVNENFCNGVTAVVARLLKARGYYRAPAPDIHTYLVINTMRWA